MPAERRCEMEVEKLTVEQIKNDLEKKGISYSSVSEYYGERSDAFMIIRNIYYLQRTAYAEAVSLKWLTELYPEVEVIETGVLDLWDKDESLLCVMFKVNGYKMSITELEKLVDIPKLYESTEYNEAYVGSKMFSCGACKYEEFLSRVLDWWVKLHSNVKVLDYKVTVALLNLVIIEVTFKPKEEIK
jgi:hypothetical protein